MPAPVVEITRLADHMGLLVPYARDLLVQLVAVRDQSIMPSNKSGAAVGAVPSTLKLFTEGPLLAVAKAFSKKFPDTDAVAKSSKDYKEFVDAFKEIKEELRPIYAAFAALADFVEHARSAFIAAARVTSYSLEINPKLTQDLIFLAHYLTTALMLVARTGKGKKAIVSAVTVLDARTGIVMDPAFPKIAELFMALDKPHTLVQEVFAPISSRLVMLLGGLKTELTSSAFANVETLRKSAVFSAVSSACSEPMLPVMDDVRLRIIARLAPYSQAVITVFFACAGDLGNDANAMALLKTALGNTTFTPSSADELFIPQIEYEALFKINNKLGKVKAALGDSLAKSKQSLTKFHRDRREFLAHQLDLMLNLSRDNPALLGSKFVVITSLLNFARDETLHYFYHFNEAKVAASKMKQPPIVQPELDVLHIIHLILGMRALIRENNLNIQRYHLTLLRGDLSGLVKSALATLQAQESLPEGVKAIVQDTSAAFDAFDMDNLATFKVFRTNWSRIKLYLSLPECLVPITSLPQVPKSMNDAATMSAFVDELAERVKHTTDLRMLAPYMDHIQLHMAEALSAPLAVPSVPIFDSIAPLTAIFASCGGAMEEKAAEFARIAVQKAAATTAASVVRLAAVKARMERKAAWDGVAMKARIATTEAFTSAESTLVYNNNPCKRLEQLKLQVSDLLAAFGAVNDTLPSNVVVRPVYALQQALSSEFSKFLATAPFDPESNAIPPLGDDMPYAIHPPTITASIVESTIVAMHSALSVLPNFPLASMIDDVLMQQNNATLAAAYTSPLPEALLAPRPPAGNSSPTKRGKPAPPRVPPTTLPFGVAIGQWYADLMTTRALSAGLAYSAKRGGLVHPTPMPGSLAAAGGKRGGGGGGAGGAAGGGASSIAAGVAASVGAAGAGSGASGKDPVPMWHPESFTDRTQLASLSRLLGPTGTQFLGARIGPYIHGVGALVMHQVNGVVGQLTPANMGGLAALMANIAKLRGVAANGVAGAGADDVMEKMAALGSLISGLSAVRSAQASAVMSTSAREIVGSAFVAEGAGKFARELQRDLGGAANLGQLTDFTSWLGRDAKGIAATDSSFDFVKMLNPTPVGIRTLLIFLATSLCAIAYSESSSFNAQYDASPNNAHCIATAVHAFLVHGVPKLPDISPDDVFRIAENVFSMASEWLLLLHRARVASDLSGKEAKEYRLVREVESAWVIVQRVRPFIVCCC
ncbi:membrane-associated apoptosis protein-domain-containing protein [Blastocladiella britannica]|nr:membrane-associated apoptosis protein-domain-containing protein [Blastocladiella britannica]